MDRKFLKVPVAVFVLAFITALFVSIPLLLLFNQLNTKLERIDTMLYVIESTQKPVLAPSSATESATPGGKAR